MASLERTFDHLDAKLARFRRKLGRAFECDDVESHRAEDRGRIAAAGADDERPLGRQRDHLHQQLAQNGRSREEAAGPDRHRPVDISERFRRVWKELLARQRPHRPEHGGIGYPLRTQLAVDHRGTRRGEVGNRSVDRHALLYAANTPEVQDRSYRQAGSAPTAVHRKTSGCEACTLNGG